MRLPLMLFVIGLASCAPSSEEQTAAANSELSRRQKDSVIAESQLPASSAVGRALDALTASERRAEAHDSIS